MANSNPKISVIVPVYNVEKYLDKCLNSLANQTYNNLEIVIVNDCSPDNSEKIIKEYCKNYKNIIYVKNEKNSGLAYSRNVGLDNATGDYIGFIDSDDYVQENYFELLYKSIVDNKSDISVCDMKLVYENLGTEEISRCCETDEHELIDFVNNGLAASACNKLFKKELINKYRFSVGKVNEDIAVVIPTLCDAKKISYTPNCYYNYIQRESSIQNSKFSEKRFDIFDGVDLTLERIKNNKQYDTLKDALVFNQIILLFIYVIPKDNRFIYRNKVISKYFKKIKKYNINQNKVLWSFYDKSGKKHQIYYRLLIKFGSMHLSFVVNILLSLYKLATKLLKKSVLKNNITLDTLFEKAVINQNYNNDVSISVVVPNYNYEKFLLQRIYSILIQKVKINEIIILDDCSKDNSRELIDDIVNKLNKVISIKSIYNKTNSGAAFNQWEKGFNLAKSDYVWIAEADDYCKKNMLKELIKPIKNNKDIIISYCDTAFINAQGNVFIKSIIPEIDIMKTGHFNSSFITDGKDEYNNYSFLNNTIANVSSCVIKKDKYDEEFALAKQYKQSGDWIFYVSLMQKGKIAYSNKTMNYYRVHGNNVSSVTKKQDHLNEIKRIHKYYENNYGLDKKQKEEINKRYEFLKEAWGLKDKK